MSVNKLTKKVLSFAAAAVIMSTSVCASFGAYAQDSTELPLIPVGPHSQQDLPTKYDLRDVNGKNYVTPVKFHQPFSTCWAFATAAAAEVSYLYENDMGVPAGQVNDQVDFSEKYIAYYTYQPITEADVSAGTIPASQVGEGLKGPEDVTDLYNKGGKAFMGVETYARFGGPVEEKTVINGETPFAYMGKNKWVTDPDTKDPDQKQAMIAYLRKQYTKSMINAGKTDIDEINRRFDDAIKDPATFEKIYEGYIGTVRSYAGYDNWSIPVNAQYRLADKAAAVKDYKIFSPINTNPNGGYEFSQDNLDALKSEISSGHALVAMVLGDALDDPNESYINPDTWAQYTNQPASADYAVTIVGYDDDYSKENFLRKDSSGKDDPTTVPPGNGAFIVKNSWGSVTPEDEKTAKGDGKGGKVYDRIGAYDFGIDKSGYYYISYYDLSFEMFISLDLYKKDEAYAKNANQYDLMNSDTVLMYETDKTSDNWLAANVFTAYQNECLSEISVYAVEDDTQVVYGIYKNFEGSDPTTGELLESGTKEFSRLGYYRFSLEGRHQLKEGDRYAVVIKERGAPTGSNSKEPVDIIPVPTSLSGSTGIINKGESLIGINGKWSDFTEYADKAKQSIYANVVKELDPELASTIFPNGTDSIIIDNFPIRAFTTPDIERLSGSSRFGTASAISAAAFDSADTVVLANGRKFADALAGVPLASALEAPILLTEAGSLPAETVEEIKRLGAKNAVILGGSGSVSAQVRTTLESMGLKCEVVKGSTRFETAVKIAENIKEKTGSEPTDIFFVSSEKFADALSVSAVAAKKNAPIIYLPKTGSIDTATTAYLGSLKGKIKNAYVIGGSGVISADVMKSAGELLGLETDKTITRIKGQDKYETCVMVNTVFADVLTGSSLCIATGADFPDALSGGVFAAKNSAPLFLVDGKAKALKLSDSQIAYLKSRKTEKIYVFGGKGAVPDSHAQLVAAQ